MANPLAAIDWKWWLEEIPVRVDWWSGADHFWYVHVARINCVLIPASVALCVLIFVLTCLRRSGVTIVIED